RLAPPALRHPVPPAGHVARVRGTGRRGAPDHGRRPATPARPARRPVPRPGRRRDRERRRLGRPGAPRDAEAGRAPDPPGPVRMTLDEALAVLAPLVPEGTVCVHANGFIGRAGCTARDRDECFYMIGSMGLASSIGLGLALAQPRRRILVVDGDGNLLMNL